MPYFTLEDGAVILDPDVREYFPSSGSFNQALLSLIALKPSNRQNRQQLLSTAVHKFANVFSPLPTLAGGEGLG